MRVLLASEPQLCRDLQVEVVINVAGRDNVRLSVFLSTCDNSLGNGMSHHFSFVAQVVFFVTLLSQIKHVLLEVGLLAWVEAVGLVAFGRHVSISLESLSFLGLGDGGS